MRFMGIKLLHAEDVPEIPEPAPFSPTGSAAPAPINVISEPPPSLVPGYMGVTC